MANQTNKVSRHELYPKALLGELDNSPIVREFLLAMKKMTSTKLMNVMDKITALDIDYLKEKLVPLQQDIIDLIEGSRKKNLSSEFDLSVADTVRATVVSKRVQLSEKKSALTKEETEYSRIIQQVHDILQEYFSLHLKGLDAVLLHEVFFYDLLSPHRDVCSLPVPSPFFFFSPLPPIPSWLKRPNTRSSPPAPVMPPNAPFPVRKTISAVTAAAEGRAEMATKNRNPKITYYPQCHPRVSYISYT